MTHRHLAQSLPLRVMFLTCKVQAGPEGLGKEQLLAEARGFSGAHPTPASHTL